MPLISEARADLKMPKHFSWVTYKRFKILLNDYSGMKPLDAIAAVDIGVKYIQDLNYRDLLLLLNIKELEADVTVRSAFMEAASQIKNHYNKLAVFGASRFQRVIIHAVNQFSGINAVAFKSEHAAKEWLID